jgi:hypothetical protein
MEKQIIIKFNTDTNLVETTIPDDVPGDIAVDVLLDSYLIIGEKIGLKHECLNSECKVVERNRRIISSIRRITSYYRK